MLTQRARELLVHSIHQNPQFRGCIIGLYDEDQSVTLHTGIRDAPAFRRCSVIVEVSQNTNAIAAPTNDQIVEINPQNSNQGRAWAELAQAGMSCGFTALSVIGAATATAAAPATFGASWLLVYAAWGGTLTSGFQCGTGLYRTFMATTGQLQALQQMENDPFYSSVITLVDRIDLGLGIFSLAGAAGAAARSVRSLRNLLRLPTNFSSLSRNAKKVAIAEALRGIYGTPGGPQSIREALSGAGFAGPEIEQIIARIARGRAIPLRIQGVTSGILARQAEPLVNSVRSALTDLGEDVFVFGLARAQAATAPDKIVTINIIESQN